MKNTVRFGIALCLGKLAMGVQKLLKMNASYYPGHLAIKICPDFLGRIEKPEKVIAVTGTNGKTTCCNMILSIMEDNGYDVLSNKLGSNVDAGIASSLISGSTLSGKAKKKTALFEVDERSSKRIYPYVQPDYLLCTNLFRDSIRRNAHPEYIFDFINDNLPEKTKLILNADDMISSRLGRKNEKVYFGIAKMPTDLSESVNIINDVRVCPICHAPITYDYVRYHHIGHAHCEHCGFVSPEADYEAVVDFEARTMKVNEKDGEQVYTLTGDSIYNAYNQAAATALLREIGIGREDLKKSFDNLKIVESRYAKDEVGDITLITHMAKGQNPVACSCVCDYVKKETGTKEIILMLDDVFDRKDSSENICWIYDADFHYLNDEKIKRIIITGVRTEDYKLRLLLGGVPEEKIVCVKEEQAAADYLKFDCDKIFLLHELYLNGEAEKARQHIRDMLERRKGA